MVIPPARHPLRFTPITWRCVQTVFPIQCPLLTESPFAHRRCYLLRDDLQVAWTGVTLPSQLIRAHAQNRIPLIDYGLGLDRRVFAGCCEPLLVDGPSRRYLRNLYMGAWTHTPSRSRSAFTRFFPGDIGLTFGLTRSARETTRHATSRWALHFEAAVIPLCSGSHAC